MWAFSLRKCDASNGGLDGFLRLTPVRMVRLRFSAWIMGRNFRGHLMRVSKRIRRERLLLALSNSTLVLKGQSSRLRPLRSLVISRRYIVNRSISSNSLHHHSNSLHHQIKKYASTNRGMSASYSASYQLQAEPSSLCWGIRNLSQASMRCKAFYASLLSHNRLVSKADS